MTIGLLVFLGTFSTAIGIGDGSQSKFYFEVTRIVIETMVYHIKPPNDCKPITSDKIGRYGLLHRYGNRDVYYDPQKKVYNVALGERGERGEKFVICEGGMKPVNLEHDIVTLDTKVCQFSTSFCDIPGGTAFWYYNTSSEFVARGKADERILVKQPMVRLLVISDSNGTFVLQLLRIVQNELNQNVWVTNVNELRVREIEYPVDDSVSRLGQYIPHAEFFNIGSRNNVESNTYSKMKSDSESENANGTVRFSSDSSSRLVRIEQMIFYTLILVLILTALYVLERSIGIIINCCILRKTRSKGCAAMCFKPFSQNMMINHLCQCYIGKLRVSDNPYESYRIIKKFRNSKLGEEMISMNIYDSVDTGYV